MASTLVSLGALLGRTGRPDEAAAHFTEALDIAREVDTPVPFVFAACHLALLPGGDAKEATDAFAAHEDRLERDDEMPARFLLWQATDDVEHLEEAHRLLMEIRDNAPEEYRESMIENVPLHRDIMAAWAESCSAT